MSQRAKFVMALINPIPVKRYERTERFLSTDHAAGSCGLQ